MNLPGIIKREGLPDVYFGKVYLDGKIATIVSSVRDRSYPIGYDVISSEHNIWGVLSKFNKWMEEEPWTHEWIKRIKKENNIK